MGIRSFFGFGQARDKPTNTARSGYSFMFGRTASGKPANERTAMQTMAVYDHPLYYLIHDEPNPEMTSFVFRETLMSNLLI